MFQKNEFKAEVVRRNLTLENVANAIGIDAATLHRKMNGASDFYRSEIEKIIKYLNLSNEDVLRIFFCRLTYVNARKEKQHERIGDH